MNGALSSSKLAVSLARAGLQGSRGRESEDAPLRGERDLPDALVVVRLSLEYVDLWRGTSHPAAVGVLWRNANTFRSAQPQGWQIIRAEKGARRTGTGMREVFRAGASRESLAGHVREGVLRARVSAGDSRDPRQPVKRLVPESADAVRRKAIRQGQKREDPKERGFDELARIVAVRPEPVQRASVADLRSDAKENSVSPSLCSSRDEQETHSTKISHRPNGRPQPIDPRSGRQPNADLDPASREAHAVPARNLPSHVAARRQRDRQNPFL